MANEFRKVTDQNGVDHPVCDDTRVDWSSYAKTGAKNFFKYPYIGGSQLVHANGITYTVDSNGVIDIDGNATGNCNYNIANTTDTYFEAGRYILSKGNNTTGISIYVNVFNNNAFVKQIALIDGSVETSAPFNIDYDGYNQIQVGVSVASGTNVNHVKVYPMLRLATDYDSTYVPYAMTNRELTDAVAYSESACTDFVEGASVEGDINKICKFGKVVFMTLQLQGVTANAWDTICSIPARYRPKETMMVMAWSNNSNGFEAISIGASGGLASVHNLTSNKVRVSASWITA